MEELAERVEIAFREHYARTSDQPPLFHHLTVAEDWKRDGEPVLYAIMNAAKIPEDAATAIQGILEKRHEVFEADTRGEETEFSSNSHYEKVAVSDDRWQAKWEDVQRSLKEEARFLARLP